MHIPSDNCTSDELEWHVTKLHQSVEQQSFIVIGKVQIDKCAYSIAGDRPVSTPGQTAISGVTNVAVKAAVGFMTSAAAHRCVPPHDNSFIKRR